MVKINPLFVSSTHYKKVRGIGQGEFRKRQVKGEKELGGKIAFTCVIIQQGRKY